jgi:hypothetical protein
VEDDLLPRILPPFSRPQTQNNLARRDPDGTHAQVEQNAQAKGEEDKGKKKGAKGHEGGTGFWELQWAKIKGGIAILALLLL